MMYLVAEGDGTYGDYYVTVTASSGNVTSMLTIKIIGAILPDHIEIALRTVSGDPARRFSLSQQLISAMPTVFNNYAYDAHNNNAIRDTYLLFSSGQQVEFYARAINGPVPSTIPINSIRYSISTILPTLTTY